MECVPNFSEGRRKEVVDEIVKAIESVEGITVLDVETDPDHNRSVVTFVGEPEAVLEAAFRGVKRAAELIDMDQHRGAHPRFGAADVVPFVPVEGVSMTECVELAHRLGKRIGEELGISSAEARKFNGTQSFIYDSLYRLTHASNPSVYGSINYRYDRIGNMVRKDAGLTDPDPLMDLGEMTSGGDKGTWNRIGRNQGDAPGPHAITSTEKGTDGSMFFGYDDNGNMTSDQGMSLTWNYQDRLVGLSKGTKNAAYIYDYSGTRKKKNVTDLNDGSKTEVLYVDKFSEIRDDKFLKYVYAGNSRIARLEDEGTSFYLHDHLGSTAFAVSESSGVLEQFVNYPYGSPRLEHNATVSNYKFTGKERDVESGLQYFEARYYSRILGRFNRVDPLTSDIKKEWLIEPQKLNFYAYVEGNPVNLIDPDGLSPRRDYINYINGESGRRYYKWAVVYGINANYEDALKASIKAGLDPNKENGIVIAPYHNGGGGLLSTLKQIITVANKQYFFGKPTTSKRELNKLKGSYIGTVYYFSGGGAEFKKIAETYDIHYGTELSYGSTIGPKGRTEVWGKFTHGKSIGGLLIDLAVGLAPRIVDYGDSESSEGKRCIGAAFTIRF